MLSDERRDAISSAALQEGLYDWVSLGDITAMAAFFGVPRTVTRGKIKSVPDWAVEPVIRDVVERGLMRVGDVYSQGHFVPFDGSDDEAIDWMMGLLRAGDRGWPFLAWLELTDRGREVAAILPKTPYPDEPHPFHNDGPVL